MEPISIHLRDFSKPLVVAWEREFRGVDSVQVSRGDIFYNSTEMQTVSVGDPFDVKADAIVSPANSFGFMGGGIDGVYTAHFGPGLQERVQTVLHTHFDSDLPVGMAVIVSTGHADIPWCISAPTMRTPADAIWSSANAYLAFRAVLRVVRRHNLCTHDHDFTPIQSILCPGLATSVGGMPPERCARQMRAAWNRVLGGQEFSPPSIEAAVLDERELLR